MQAKGQSGAGWIGRIDIGWGILCLCLCVLTERGSVCVRGVGDVGVWGAAAAACSRSLLRHQYRSQQQTPSMP